MGTKAKLSTKVISVVLSALMMLSCVGVALPSLAPKAFAASEEQMAWQALADAYTAAYNGGYMSTKDWSSISSSGGVVTITDGTTNGYAYNIVAALGDLLNLIGQNKHNSELRTLIEQTLADDYGVTLNTYQQNFQNTILDCSGIYGTYSPENIWNGNTADLADTLTAQTIRIDASRLESAAILSDFDGIEALAAAQYKVVTTYSIALTATAKTCESNNDSETGAYYVNSTVDAAPGEAAEAADKTQLVAIKAYLDYVATPAFSDKYNAWYNGGLINSESLYDYSTVEIQQLYQAYGNVYAPVATGELVYREEYIGESVFESHKAFADAANNALTVVSYKDYVAWLVNGTPYPSALIPDTRNRGDYETTNPESIEAVIAQAQTFKSGMSGADANAINILKGLYPGFDPATAYNAEDSSTYYANFDNFIRYMSSLLYNYYLQEIKAAANVLLNNGAGTTYTFSNETSKFFKLLKNSVGADDYELGTDYVLTSDTQVDQDKTYYVRDAVYTYAPTADTEIVSSKHYFTNWAAGTPTASDIGSYYEDVQVFTYAAATAPFDADKTYYTLADGVYTPVEDPVEEALGTYFVRTGSYQEYQPTQDSEPLAGKTYYKQSSTYTVVTSPSKAYIGTYAERTLDHYNFVQTQDDTIIGGKTYYTSAGVKIEEPTADGLSSYYEIKYEAVDSPVRSYLFDYYEKVGTYYGLKGVGEQEYIEANYDTSYSKTSDTEVDSTKTYYTYNEETGVYTKVTSPDASALGTYYERAQCPINDTDLAALYTFFSNAVTMINNAGSYGVDVSRYMSAVLVEQIEEMATALYNEQVSRGRVTEAFLQAYQPVADKMAGYVVKGAGITQLYDDIKWLESKYDSINSTYTWFANDARGKAVKSFLSELYNEIYDRVQAQYAEIKREYDEHGSAQNIQTVYQLRQNMQRLYDLQASDGTYIREFIAASTSYGAGKVTGSNSLGSRTSSNLTRGVNWNWLSTATNYINNLSGIYNAVRDNKYTKGNIERAVKDEDMLRETLTSGRDIFTAWFSTNSQPASGNYAKVSDTLAKLDNFLTNSNFTALLGADELGLGITTLGQYIKYILATKLFTDEMVNTLVGLLFPMLTDLFEITIVKLLKDLSPMDMASFNVDNLSGTLRIYANGDSISGRSSIPFETLTHNLGANIYPKWFGQHLIDNGFSVIGNDIKGADKGWTKYRFDDNGNQSSAKDPTTGEYLYKADFKTYLEKNNKTYDWGINSIQRNTIEATANARYERFCTVLGVIFGSALPLLKCLFGTSVFSGSADGAAVAWCNPVRYKIPVIGNASADIVAYDLKASLEVNYLDLYETLWIPLMEGLGINGDLMSYTFAGVSSFQTGDAGTDRTALVHCLLDPVWSLINTLAAAPVTSVLKLLPNICYHLMIGSVNNLLNRHVIFHVWGRDCSLDKGDDGGLGSSIIAAIGDSFFSTTIAGAIDIKEAFDLGEKLNLEDMLGFSLRDINTVLAGVLGMIKEDAVYKVTVGSGDDAHDVARTNLPGIGTGKVATMYKSISNTYGSAGKYTTYGDKVENFYSRNGNRTYVTANTEVLFYALFEWVFRVAQTKGGLADLLDFVGKLSGSSLGDSIPDILFALLEGIESSDLAFAALIELLNEPEYAISKFKWYGVEGSNLPSSWTGATFYYLQYNNKWTDEKAQYVYENVDNIVNAVVNMITPETLEAFGGDVNVWLDRTINSMFNNEGIMNVMEVVIKLGQALESSPGIVKMLRQQVTMTNSPEMNLYDWYNVWGYLYSEPVTLENNQFIAYNVQNNQVYVYEAVPNKEDVETVTLTATNTMSSSATYTWKIIQAYPVAPNETIPWQINGTQMSVYNGKPYDDANKYGKYKNLFSNLRWTPAGTSEDGDLLYTWEIKLTSDIISHLKDNGTTLKRIGSEGNYTGYYDNGATYAVNNTNTCWYPLIDGKEVDDPSSLNARAIFSAVFAELAGPLSTIFTFILGGKDLYLFGSSESTALTIQGYPAYNNAILPLMEVLGVYDLKTQAEYNTYASSYGAKAAFDYLVNELFGALDNLLTDDRDRDSDGELIYYEWDSSANDYVYEGGVKKVGNKQNGKTFGKGAFQKFIDVLPHFYYFLQSDGLTTILKNLPMFAWQLLDTLRPVANIDVDNLVRTLMCRIMKYAYDYEGKYSTTPGKYKANALTAALLDMLGIEAAKETDATVERDKNKVAAIFNFTIKNMTLDNVWSLVMGLTGLDLAPLTYALQGMVYTMAPVRLNKYVSGSDHGPYAYTSYVVPGTSDTYKTYTLNFEGRDTITVTICALIDILKYEQNAAALDELLGTMANLVPGAENLLTGEGLGGLIQALVRIMDDEPYGIEIERPNWDYIFEHRMVRGSDNVTDEWTNIFTDDEILGTGANNTFTRWAELKWVADNEFDFHNFHLNYMTNLQYLTSWTQGVADSTTDVLLSVLDYVVSLIDLSDQFTEGTDLSSFSKVVDALLSQKVFTPDLLMQLVDLLANVYNYLPDDILDVINHLLTDNAADGAVVDMFAWRKAGYVIKAMPWHEVNGEQVQYAEGAVDEENKPIKPVWQANRAYDWFVEGTATYIDSESDFMNAFKALIEPAGTLFAIIFLGEDYNLFKSLTVNSQNSHDSVVINATNAYATALVPILEALGLDLANYAPSKYKNPDNTYDGAGFVDDLIELVDILFNDIIYGPRTDIHDMRVNAERSGGPVAWLLANLPTIIYFINADGLKASINNVFGAVNAVLDAVSTVVSLPVDLHNIMESGLDLTNITFEGVFGMIYTLTKSYEEDGTVIPGLYMSESLLNYINTMYIGKLVPFTSVNGYQSFKMEYIPDVEDESEMVTILLALALEWATDSGTFIDTVDSHGNEIGYDNAATLDRLLFKGSEMEGAIGQVIHALRNPQSLTVTDMDWDYFVPEGGTFDLSTVEDDPITVPYYAFQYLNWTTEWTYEKAETASEEFENLVFQVLKMLAPTDPEDIADVEPGSIMDRIINAETLGDILSIDFIFSADILNKVLDFLSNLLYGEESVLNSDMIALIGYVLGGDLTEWNGDYGFVTVPKNESLPAGCEVETVADISGVTLNYLENVTVEVPAVLDDDGVTVITPATTKVLAKQYQIREGNRNDFIAGLIKVLVPAQGILAWLLFGEDYTFFNPHDTTNEYLLSIPGSYGYKEGLVLLLEALGWDSNLKYSEAYIGHPLDFVKDLANSVADGAELICTNPVGQLVELIPEIIYFINAGGLAKTVTGLLSGPLGLVAQVSALAPVIQRMLKLPETVTSVTDETGEYALVEQTIDSVLKSLFQKQGYTVELNDDGTTDVDFKLTGVNLQYVINVLEVVTGMEISDVIGNKLDKFAIGAIRAYASKCGEIGEPGLAYKMGFGTNSSQGTNDSFADFITILLSAVVDLIEYQNESEEYVNVEALAKLLKLKDDAKGILLAVAGLLQTELNAEILPIDWFYFDNTMTRYEWDADEQKLVLKDPQPVYDEHTVTVPEPSINYLTYASDWTQETSQYIVDHFEEIIDGVLGMFLKDEATGEPSTLADIINDNFTLENNVFTYENYSAVVGGVADIAGQIPEVVNTLLNIALEMDLSGLSTVAALDEADYNALSAEGKKNAFLSGIITILTPLRPIAEWLLFNQSIEYFDKDLANSPEGGTGIEKLISISGASGYNDALVPLLEAIGVQCPSYTVSATATVAERNVAFGNFLSILFEKVLSRVEEILQNPADSIVDLLPNIIYFLNANGLATVLNNLVAPLVGLINEAVPALFALTAGVDLDDDDLDENDIKVKLKKALVANNLTAESTLDFADVIKLVLALLQKAPAEGEEPADTGLLDYILENINLTKLDLVAILRLVEGILSDGVIKIKDETAGTEKTIQADIKLVDVVGAEKIEKFYLKGLEYFESANGKAAFRMPGSADMITVFINYLLEVLLYQETETSGETTTVTFSNAAELDKILNDPEDPADLVTRIVNLIYGIREIQEAEPAEINWHYYGTSTEIGDGIFVPNHKFVYLNYSNQWTFEKAVYIDSGLTDLVKQVLTLAGVEDGDISGLIGEVFNLADYLNAGTLNSILGIFNGLFSGDNGISLPQALTDLIGLILNVDITAWNGTYDFVDAAAEGAEVAEDEDIGLSYYDADGVRHFIVSTANDDYTDFSSGLQLILEPAQGLLGWLLLGNTFAFFVPSSNGNVDDDDNRLHNELIRVPGSNGYDAGLVLLLEALGCENVKPYTDYALADGTYDCAALLKDVIDSLLARVNVILQNPIEELLALIPEIIYFININGLGALVQNVASVLLAIVNEVLESHLLDSMVEGDLAKYLTKNNDGTNAEDEPYNGTYRVDLDAIVTDLLKELLGDKAPADFAFSFDSVNMQFVIDMVEIFTGLEIDEVVGYTMDKFIIGVVERYVSASETYTETYKVSFTEAALDDEGNADHSLIGQTRADMITILLSLVIDLLDNDDNVDAIVELINGFIDDPEKKIDADTINAIMDLIKGGNLDDMIEIDWFYFSEEKSLYEADGVTLKDPRPTVTYDDVIDTPERTINYIEYYTDWTKDTADYLANNINAIVNEVLAMVPGINAESAADLIAGYFTVDQLYTKDLFVTILDAIQGLIDQYGETLVNTIGLIVGGDFSVYANIDTDALEVDDKESFINTLVTVLEPIYTLLNWFLFGEDMKYFYDNDYYNSLAAAGTGTEVEGPEARNLINLSGSEGYKYGLVPLLEALGVELPEFPDSGKLVAGEDFMGELLTAVFTRLENILADPITEVVAMLPELLYFINAGGLTASVYNLLNAVVGLLPQISEVIAALGIDIKINGKEYDEIDIDDIVNDLLASYLPEDADVTVNVKHITLITIAEILEAFTGLEITDVVTASNIRYFYFGQLVAYDSGSGNVGFKMVYSEDEGEAEMLTLLINFVVEVLLYKNGDVDNVAALKELLDLSEENGALVDTIIKILKGEIDPYSYEEMNWNYFDESVVVKTVDPDTGVATYSPALTVPTSQFIYLEYENDWTLERANGIDENLAALVDGVLQIVNSDAEYTLSDLLNGYYEDFAKSTVFTAGNLNTILELLQNYLYGENAFVGQHLAEFAGLVLGADITSWNYTYSFADYDEDTDYITDADTGLRYNADGGIKVYAIETEEDFINGLYVMLQPAAKLLSFILLGDSYNFFAVDQDTEQVKAIININGVDTYGYGLSLLLEALGVEGLKKSSEYGHDGAAFLKELLTALVGRIHDIIRDPVNEVLDLLPELIYFINANGLGVIVNNLVGALVNIAGGVVDALNIEQLNALYIDGEFDPIGYVENYLSGLISGLVGANVTFTVDGVNLQWIINLVEAATGLRINEVLQDSEGGVYALEKFVLGTPTKYDTKSNFDGAYRIEFPETDKYNYRCDLITILLSFAIEFLENGVNQGIIEDEFGLVAGTIADVLVLIKERSIEITPDYDWFYFDEGASFTGSEVVLTMPERTINYLSYASNWDENFADYLDDHLNSIIASVLDLMGKGDTTVAAILEGYFSMSNDVYKIENLETIRDAIKNLVAQLEGMITEAVGEGAENTVLADALDIFFDIDLHAWDNMEFDAVAVSYKEGFAAAIADIVAPLSDVLNWLFFGSSIRLFNRRDTATGTVEDIVVINGYDGYNAGLVPLLEALGVDLTDAKNVSSIREKVEKIVLAALTRAEAILANPVDEVLALLPEILYFINANGLAASVNHALGSVLSLVDGVNAILSDLSIKLNIAETEYTSLDLNTLINNLLNNALAEQLNGQTLAIDTQKLDLIEIVKLVEQFTGLQIVNVVTEAKIDNFYLGQIYDYESANGRTLFKMAYSEDAQKDRADMLTVVANFAAEIALANKAKLEEMFGLEEGTIDAFLNMLDNLAGDEYPYDWNYFYGEDAADDEGYEAAFDRYATPDVQFGNYLTYKSDWTKTLANDLYNNLDTIINSVLAMTHNEYATLGEIINHSFTLYKGEYLNAILGLVKKLYDVIDDTVLLGLADELLDIDLTYWQSLPEYDEEATYGSTEFAAAVVEMVQPIYSLIDWLFFGKEITLFVDNATGTQNLIVIPSVDAYATGLVPILEALGVELPAYDGTQKCATEVTYNGVTMSFFSAIVNAALDRVNAILADPIPEVLELLPELLYFVNANGLSTAVYNMLGGVIEAVNTLIGKGIINLPDAANVEAYVFNNFGIDITKLDLVGIFSYVEGIEALHGLKLNEVFTVENDFNPGVTENVLEYFYIGDYANAYVSSAAGFKGYKLSLDEENKGDLLTMLLSVVLEVLLYDGNEEAVTAIIQSFRPEFTTDNFHALKLLLTAGIQTDPTMNNINWVYFWNYSEEELQAKITEALSNADTEWPAEPAMRTQNALKYSNNWNTDVRDYLDQNLESIIDLAIQMATKNSDQPAVSLSDLLGNVLDLWSSKDVNPDSVDLANLLLGYIKRALGNIDAVLVDTVGSLLGAGQLSNLMNAEAVGLESKEDFVDFMVETLSPLSNVLDFVLFGGEYKFFTQLDDGEPYTIMLKGGEGYKYGLAPILAALGVDTDITVARSDVALREVFTNLTNRIDDILYGGDTVNEALKLILNVIYFIDADGLSTSVLNLLAPIDELLKEVNDELHIQDELTVNGLITQVDLANLNMDFLFSLVQQKTGINVADPIGDYLKTFYFGATEFFTSYGDLGNFRMVYSEAENRIDFITVVVTLLLDVVIFDGNHEALVALVQKLMDSDAETAEQYVDTIVALLTNKEASVPMQNYKWAFLVAEDGTVIADSGIVISAANGRTGDSIFNDALYGDIYTRDMGVYMSTYLPLAIDTYIVLLGVKRPDGSTYTGLNDIIKNLIGTSIYTNKNLRAIADAITGAVANLKSSIGDQLFNHIVNVLNASLGVDLNDLLYGRVATITDGNEQQFIKAICDLLAPVAPILRWLLSDNYDIALFNHDTVVNSTDTSYAAGDDYLVLHGADGYQNAIIPILEALCVGENSNIKTQAEFDAITNNSEMISTILTPIFKRLNTILNNPIEEIFRELPAVVYFLNSNGLDTAVKNLLNAVYSLLYTIEPLIANVDSLHNSRGEIDLLALANIDLSEINANTLIQMVIDMISDDIAQYDLTDVIADAVTELTLGTVDKFTSVRELPEYLYGTYGNGQVNHTESGNAIDYTMHYSANNGGGDTADYVSIILRLLLKFISIPQNVTALEALLSTKLTGDGYKFVCSLLENFSQMAASDLGMQKIMYTVYYIFYAALNAGVATNNGLARFNGDYSFLNQLFATSNVGFLRQLEISLGGLLNKYTPEIVDDDEVIPQGQISFWQRIIEFFKKIGDFFKRLFGG